MPSKPPKPQRQPLDQQTILDVAFAFADEHGVDALSMRKLADKLGFKVMSLYNHVANKNELLTLMVDAVAAEVDEVHADDPIEYVRAFATSTRAALARHPWAPTLWLQLLPGEARTRHMERLLQALANSGLSPELAHHGFHAVNNHVLGYTLQEQGMSASFGDLSDLESAARDFLSGLDGAAYPHTTAHVHQHLDGDTESSFDLVLDFILDGLVRMNADELRRRTSG